jgi:hypothetical protein
LAVHWLSAFLGRRTSVIGSRIGGEAKPQNQAATSHGSQMSRRRRNRTADVIGDRARGPWLTEECEYGISKRLWTPVAGYSLYTAAVGKRSFVARGVAASS